MNRPRTVSAPGRARRALHHLIPTAVLVAAVVATYGAGFGLETLAGVA